MTSTTHRLRGPVLIVGAYGYDNVGDEAILSGVLTLLKGQSVTVVSRSPVETAAIHGVPSIAIGQVVPALRLHRSVLIGGGGLFGRDMGRIGRLLPAFGLLAVALGRTVAVEGVDVDERLSRSARILLPLLLRASARVGVRDRTSGAILARWGIRPAVAPDLSAWMPAASAEVGRRMLERAGLDLDRPIVGLALTAVNPGLTDQVVASMAAAMAALPEAQFCCVPMSRHARVPAHDDRHVAQRLAALRPELAVLDGPLPPAEVLAAVGQLSAVVAMRYHAMVFAERAGTPLIPIPYAEKTQRWLRERQLRPVAPEVAALTRALRAALTDGAARNRRLLKVAS